jgi:hypothetical protein
MKSYVVAFCGLMLAAAPAFAQQGGSMSSSGASLATQGDQPESTGNGSDRTPDGQRRICRRVTNDSSSRMGGHRVCRTAQEWRDAQDQAGN